MGGGTGTDTFSSINTLTFLGSVEPASLVATLLILFLFFIFVNI